MQEATAGNQFFENYRWFIRLFE